MSGYQSYPSSGKPVEPDRGEAPPSVQKAVKLMYAGAAVSAVSLIVSVILPLASIASSKAALKKDHPKLTVSQVNQTFNLSIGVAVIFGVIGTVLWLWMARANGQGKNWARITSSVFFLLETLSLFSVLNAPSVLGVVFTVAPWVIGLGAIIFLWRRESSEFFKPRQLG
jgi:ABC-type Fe3+ transport system permease subunit